MVGWSLACNGFGECIGMECIGEGREEKRSEGMIE